MGKMENLKKSFPELLNNWLDDYLPNVLGRSYNTIVSYKKAWELMVTFLFLKKNIPADKISFDIFSFDLIMEYLDWIDNERNCKDSTRNNRRAAIVRFAEYAQNYNFDAACKFYLAAGKVPDKKAQDSVERVAMNKEQTRIMLNLPDLKDRYGHRDLTLLNFLYGSGGRAQEVCDMKVKDVRFLESGHASIHFHGKGLKDRRIRIGKSCASLLRKHMQRTKVINQPNSYVFKTQRNPQMSVVAIERIVGKYASRAKKECFDDFSDIRITPHVFRHTTATHMLEAGVPLMVVSRFLGHSDIKTTLVYAKLSETDVNEKLRNWDRNYWGEYMEQPLENDDSGMTDTERNLSKIFSKVPPT